MRRKGAACDRSRFEQLLGQSLLLTERLAARVDIYARTETDRASRSDLHGGAGTRITSYARGRQCTEKTPNPDITTFSPPRNLSTDILNNDSTILLTSFFGRAKSFATASIN